MNGLKSRVSQFYLGISLAGGLVHSTATHTHTHKHEVFKKRKKGGGMEYTQIEV